MDRDFDIIIIGGGHAGAEAAWAASRLGAKTALITLDPQRIGQMSCNPAIGGLAKGQMVREIDALGGLMGLAIDATGIQFRMLNRSKGPAVWGPRAQADKRRYARQVQHLLQTCPNLSILTGEVADILTTPATPHRRRVTGILLADGASLSCRAVIVTTGTFLRALMHTGEIKTEGGRVGEASAKGLSGCLQRLGLQLGRLKTGTPPRLQRDSIDFSSLEIQPGDDEPMPFSYLNEYKQGSGFRDSGCATAELHPESRIPNPGHRWFPPLIQSPCWITQTSQQIHDLIRANLHRAPMYSGQIQSTGPRYCPSIEDKVVRFADKTSHHIFLEPEGLDTDEVYANGISTSLPKDVQEQIIPLIPGLEKAKILRYGYAVEYDMVWPTQIDSCLHVKTIPGLFLAGQINGTSGYEEAAGQGLVAGINAARYAADRQPDFILRRDQAYIGVMIDDLVTKPPIEPYRMFTSRSEHRLHLRADNADQRLTPIGRNVGLVDDTRFARFTHRQQAITAALALLQTHRLDNLTAAEWLRRPENIWPDLRRRLPHLPIPDSAGRQAEIILKYEGYITRQQKQIDRFARMETKLIPPTLDYNTVTGLRNEARQSFLKFTPRSLGQALRLTGITPADVTVLAVHLSKSPRSPV